MEFVPIPGGSFDMGDLWGNGSIHERPVHRVTIRPFLMGKYPVTQAQWKKIISNNPSVFVGDDRPVDSISWDDCREFIRRLNQVSKCNYRLPSEAQWEYAARSGGKRHKWSGTDDEIALGEYAWHCENSNEESQPVGQKLPNDLGLYDMSGNLWEWCQDLWHDTYHDAPNDGSAWEKDGKAGKRVLRGGSWFSVPTGIRAAFRVKVEPGSWGGIRGFRLAL